MALRTDQLEVLPGKQSSPAEGADEEEDDEEDDEDEDDRPARGPAGQTKCAR